MPKRRPLQTNFTTGEVSPRLLGRTDVAKYYNGAAKLENFLVHPHGGASKRPGTHYVANSKSNAQVRLIPFEFNTSDAYILEFGANYMRVFRNGAVVGAPYELATPWSLAEVQELQFAQSADTMWMVHPSHKPRKLTRTAHTSWTLSNYAPTADPFTSANNYPRAVTFFQQRLVFGGTNTNPQLLLATKAGDFNDMTVGTADDDAYTYSIVSGTGRIPVIQWLAGGDVMLIGTAGSEFRATGGNNQAITPTNIDVKERTTNGSAGIQPETISNTTLYVQRAGRKIRDFKYTLEVDGYTSSDLTILSEHITKGGISRLSYQAVPDALLWAVRADGTLLGFTYEPDQEVFAWHRHIFGGADVEVESVASIPSSTGEEVWIAVKRTVNGGTVRHIEYLDNEAWREDLDEAPTDTEIIAAMPDCHYVDSGLIYDGAPATVMSGLGHLEGETVSILADGAVHPSKVVSSGQVTLERSASVVHIGLPYTATVKTLPVGDAGDLGAMLGRRIGWSALAVRLYLSGGGSIQGEQILYRKGGDPMDSPPPLKTSVERVNDSGYDDEGQVTITQSEPLPFTVLSIGGELQVND